MINLLVSLLLILNILFWYAFTMLSTVYSKKYLNISHDAHTLTLVTFFYAALLKLVKTYSLTELVALFKNYEYLCLGLFNVGTILFTNIGINETSVSLTYMVKVIILVKMNIFLLL